MFSFEGVPPEKGITFTRRSVILTFCWPLPTTATNADKLRFKALRLFFIVNAILLLIPLIYAVQVHGDKPDEVARAVVLSGSILQVLFRTSFCAYHHDVLQRLVADMESYCANAKAFERRVLQKYMDRYSALYGLLAIAVYLMVGVIILGTFFTADPMPANAEYPFDIYSQPLRSVIFVHQSVVGMQCASHLNITVFSALLTFFAAARFENLRIELESIGNIRLLGEYIKKYHDIKRYAKEVVRVTKPLAVITIASRATSIIFSAISILGKQPNKVQFYLLAGSSVMEVFTCALPCDHLMTMSMDLSNGLYELQWYEQTRSLQRCVLIALAPQSPVILSVPCILPGLTLNYFCSFISNVFSIYTVMRVMLIGD